MESYRVIDRSLRDQLGEGLLWSERENAVYWVDILAQSLHRLALGDESVSSWPMPERIGWVIERQNQRGFIAGLQSGFHELTLDPLTCRHLVDPEPQYPKNRLNDAGVDGFGRIWAGTMDVGGKLETGSLYCLEPNLKATRRDTGYIVTNGPVFSPDNRFLYHNDTPRGVVYRFSLTARGELRDKTEFLHFPREWGFPDGMTMDAEGGLWIAHWGGGRISRFDPDGDLERLIRLPASQVTNCVFGGMELDRLFVTSAATGCDREPLAGVLFEVDAGGIKGLPPRYFAG
jgi:sugar lactone lactonase YvrE